MPEHLTAMQLDELRRLLLTERHRLLARAGIDIGDGDVEPTDIQDKAAEEAGRRAQIALGDHDRDRLREVEDALGRMGTGRYGVCEETGEPIPFERLRLEPTTRYTVEALELLEDESARERMRNEVGNDDPY
jgi:DnaK suppressor protein